MSTLLILFAVHIVIVAALLVNLLRQRFEPYSMLVWILVIWFVPFIGALLYARLGENRVLLRAQRRRGRCLPPTNPSTESIVQPIQLGAFAHTATVGKRLLDATVTKGNEVTIYNDTEEVYQTWLKAIRDAKKSVHMLYYIWRSDDTGNEFKDLICEKARQGVTCRVLVDAVGSFGMSNGFAACMKEAGVNLSFFLPFATWRRRWSPHLRNHRKILCIDGEVAYVGSQNIDDASRGRNPYIGAWHDLHLGIRGPAVNHVEAIFLDDWNFSTGEQVEQEIDPEASVSEDGATVQVLPTGPDCKDHVLERVLLEAFSAAESSIDIVTPYFIPSTPLRISLLQAALHGVKVRLILSGANDVPVVLYAGRSFYKEFLEEGVEIYEYETGMLHSKIAVVDRHWAIAGSANMDLRSFRLNFEISALLYDDKLATQLTDVVDGYCEGAKFITQAALSRVPFNKKLLEGAARVLSPQL